MRVEPAQPKNLTPRKKGFWDNFGPIYTNWFEPAQPEFWNKKRFETAQPEFWKKNWVEPAQIDVFKKKI